MKLTREEMNRIMKGEGNKPSPFSGFGNTDNKPSPFQDPYGFSAVNKQIENLPRFSVSKEDYENFADYDVYLNAYTTREEAEKQRAKNQSWIEQTGRAVTQAVANEFILGTLSGFSNMYDAVYNLIANDGYNDYTNAVSTALEKAQDSIRERFAIYQENPGKSFDIGDFGWWANNAISVASTLSMLIPSTGIVKGIKALGKIGKGTKTVEKLYNKGIYGISKIAEKSHLTSNPARTAKSINTTLDLGTTAVLSRTMENYMEAREVYKDIYDTSIERLQNFNDAQREEFFKNNPEFVGLNDEEIAKKIASDSAGETFVNDYAMLLMDVVQFKAISSLWKGAFKLKPTAKLKYINKQAANKLNADAANIDIEQQSLIKRLLQGNSTFLAENLSESFEEGYQGVQTEKGKEVAELIFDPTYRPRDLSSYLSDPKIWEQAVWGYLGGVGFQAAGRGLGNLQNKIQGKINKKRMSPEDYNRSQLTFEKIREAEILGRRAKINDYLEQLSLLDEGKNPFKPIKENGTISDYENITQDEADIIYDRLANEFVVDMVLNAADAGNIELLQEYITNPEFNKFFDAANINIAKNKTNFTQELVNKMNNTIELYQNEIYKGIHSIDGDNDQIIRNIARENVKKYFNLDLINQAINRIDTDITKLDPNGEFNRYEAIDEYQFGIQQLVEINKHIDDIYKLKDTDYIVKDQLIKELKEKKQNIVDRLNENTIVAKLKTKDFGNILINADENWLLNNVYNVYDDYYNNDFSNVPDAISKFIGNKTVLLYQTDDIRNSIPTTKQQLQDRYNQINRVVDQTVSKALNDAFTNIGHYIETSVDPAEAFNDVLAKKVPELEKDIEILKLGASNDFEYYYLLKEIRDEAIDKIEAIKTNNNDNEAVNKEREEILEKHPIPTEKEIIDNNNETTKIINDAQKTTGEPSSTGEQVKAPTESTNPIITDLIEDRTVVGFEEEQNPAEALALQDAIRIREAINIPSNDELGETDVTSSASLFALQMYRNNKDLYKGLDGENFNNDNAKTLLSQIEDKLELEGYNKDLIKSGAIKGLKIAIKHINNRLHAKGLPNLAAQIIDNINVIKNAISPAIPTSKLNDTIDKFLDEYIKSINIKPNKNGSTLIDIVQLFDYLINNKDIGYEQAKLIYINMYDYIINHTSNKEYNKYIFKNIRLVKDNYISNKSFVNALEKANYFLQQVQYAKREYEIVNQRLRTAITNKVKTDSRAREIYYNLKPGDKLDIERNGKLLFFKKDGIEIGYSIIPTTSSDGNTVYMPKEKGFRYNITKNGSTYSSSYFDELFIKLIEQSEDVQDLLTVLNVYESNIEVGAIINESLSEQETDDIYNSISEQSKKPFEFVNSKGTPVSNIDGAKIIVNHPIIKKLIDDGYIGVDTYKVVDAAKIIANEILSVLNYDGINISPELKIRSYRRWLSSMYANLQQTKDIADNGLNYKITVENTVTGVPITSQQSLPINSPALKFTYENNPVIAVMNSGTVNIEGSKTTYPSRGMTIKTMGLLIQDNDGSPAYALFTEENKVDKSNQIYNDLKEELKNIIKERLSGGNFDEFTDKLASLFGGNNRGFNNLFKGYSVASIGDITALAFKGRKDNYTLVAYRYKKDSNEESTAIRYYKNGNSSSPGKIISKVEGNERIIDDIVEEILSNTQYFKSFVAIRNQDVINGKINKYLSKRNGKLVLTLNGKEFVYNNFTEFILKNNAFNTNQDVDKFGHYFEVNKKGFFIEAQKSTPVKEEQQDRLFTPDDIFDGDSSKTVYSGRSIAEKVGIDESIINIAEDLDLLPKEVRYSKRNTKAKAQTNKNSILLFKHFVTAVNKDKYEAMRILIHERLHQILNEQVGNRKQEYVNEILDIYNEAKLAIKSNPDKYGHLISAFDTILNPDTYFNYLDKSAQEYWNSRSKEERDSLFAEEFLVESLTQRSLIDALNEIKSTSDKAIIDKQTPKTLWQRIIDALIKIFGIKFDNIENNTILAREYNLFGNLFNDTIAEIQTVEQQKDTTIETKEESADIITKNQLEDIETDTFSEFEDDVFAVTDKLIESNENITASVNEYLNNYNEQDKPLMARFVKNGWMKIVC
jgi:hypothetical protein